VVYLYLAAFVLSQLAAFGGGLYLGYRYGQAAIRRALAVAEAVAKPK
jgi:hypothetical protein